MKAVGFDPSINDVGAACIEGPAPDTAGTTYLESITIQTGDTEEAIKLQRIEDGVARFIRFHQPDKIGVEEPPPYLRRSKISYRNLNAVAIQKLNMAYGVIIKVLADLGYTQEKGNLITVSANAGLAKKKTAQAKVKSYYGVIVNTHEADATVVALYVLGRI